MNEIFFQGFWRMDWGLGNPNKTAALIAILMVAVWSLAYLRNWLFWVSLMLFSALGICLVHTFSRGGMVAAFCGLIPLLVCLRRPLPVRRIIGVVAAVWVIIGASIYLQAHERYGQGVVQEDRSISNRFVLWKAAPTMMVDAPGGWGLGESGKAYMDWYQPLDRNESYRTLVNSHLTWLVEFGWLGRFLYIFGWLAVFLLCLPKQGNRWLAVPLGIWISLFTGAWFSSVGESIWLWIVPAIALGWVIVWRIRNHAWPETKLLLLPPALSAGSLICLSLLVPHSPVTKRGNALAIGNGVPSTWVVADRIVLGKSFPRPLRDALAKNPQLSCGIVESMEDLPDSVASTLIFSGKLDSKNSGMIESKLKSVKSLTLVNPAFFPAEFPIPKGADVRIAIGEFSQLASASDWSPVAKVEPLVGIGDFVPTWPSVLLTHQP
ncbi:MAG: O-antigen ligase family protein [Terrimicrobiaceae bacterium]